jgi:hypothetical protein
LRLSAALEVLARHDLFATIASELPLGIREACNDLDATSGLQAAFEHESYIASMSCNGEYAAGINIFRHDWKYSATPGIPIRKEALDALIAHYFKTPARFPGVLVISVPPGAYRPLDCKGALQAVSPEEMRAAFLLAIARDIDRDEPHAVLRNWIKFALSCTATFVYDRTPADKYFRSCQLRENLTTVDHDFMRRTALQKIYEVIRFRDLYVDTHGPCAITPAAIAAAYTQVKVARGRNPISVIFVDTAFTVHNRLLFDADIAALLLEMDGKPRRDNPFDGAQTLQTIISKAKTTPRIKWVLMGMVHMLRNGVPAKSEQFTIRGIGGTKETANRGLAHALIFKNKCLAFLLGRLPFNLGFSDGAWLALTRTHLADYKNYSEAPADWTRSLTHPQLVFVRFCENLVYRSKFDACLKV